MSCLVGTVTGRFSSWAFAEGDCVEFERFFYAPHSDGFGRIERMRGVVRGIDVSKTARGHRTTLIVDTGEDTMPVANYECRHASLIETLADLAKG